MININKNSFFIFNPGFFIQNNFFVLTKYIKILQYSLFLIILLFFKFSSNLFKLGASVKVAAAQKGQGLMQGTYLG